MNIKEIPLKLEYTYAAAFNMTIPFCLSESEQKSPSKIKERTKSEYPPKPNKICEMIKRMAF
jgi:hypothetical protein